MSNQKYDVVIDRGSFGGLMAGKEAAEKGLKTLILERGRKPGDKILSGCGIPPWIFLEMPWLEEAPIERWVNSSCNHLIENGNVHTSVQVESPNLIPFIYCQKFLNWLKEKAENAGAELRTSTVSSSVIKEKGQVRGIITEDGSEIRSDIVIAADGMWSMTATRAGLRRKLQPDNILHLVAYDMVMPSKEELDQALGGNIFHVFWDPEREIMPEHFVYLGIFPYENSFHVEGGTSLTHLGNKRRDYDKLYRDFFEMPWYRERFANAKLRARMWRPYPTFEGLQGILRGHDNTYGNGIMVVGDAAGFMGTASSAGIPQALLSGRMAAEVAAEAVSKGDASKNFLKQYEEKWRNSLILPLMNNYSRRDIFRSSDVNSIKRNVMETYFWPMVLQEAL
jgi:electron transfer flavoprotein-quinone oxidoreductase